MDKSIEERAKEYALNYDDKYQVAMFKAYLEGATEQKAIDDDHLREVKKKVIEKACKTLCMVCNFYEDCVTHCCPKYIRFKKLLEE